MMSMAILMLGKTFLRCKFLKVEDLYHQQVVLIIEKSITSKENTYGKLQAIQD